MTIQTRNKRKNWQAKLGTNAHKVFCQRLLSSLSVPVKWALSDQVMGIDRPSYGHSLPVLRASSAQSVRRFLGTFCQITSRRRLYHMATKSFLRHDTENPTSPCNFKDNGRDYTDNQARIVRMPFWERFDLQKPVDSHVQQRCYMQIRLQKFGIIKEKP